MTPPSIGLSPAATADTVRRFFRRSFFVSPPPRVPWRERKVDLFFAEMLRRSDPSVTKSSGPGRVSARDLFGAFLWE